MYLNHLTKLALFINKRTTITSSGLSPLEEVFGLSYTTYSRCNLPGRYLRLLRYLTTPATIRVHGYLRNARGYIYICDRMRQHDLHHSLRANHWTGVHTYEPMDIPDRYVYKSELSLHNYWHGIRARSSGPVYCWFNNKYSYSFYAQFLMLTDVHM